MLLKKRKVEFSKFGSTVDAQLVWNYTHSIHNAHSSGHLLKKSSAQLNLLAKEEEHINKSSLNFTWCADVEICIRKLVQIYAPMNISEFSKETFRCSHYSIQRITAQHITELFVRWFRYFVRERYSLNFFHILVIHFQTLSILFVEFNEN